MRLVDADQFGVISLQGKSEDFIEGVAFMLNKIDEAPTVEERPHGKWIRNDAYGYKCSTCGRTVRTDVFENPYKSYPYCHCGARMKEVW